MTFDNRQLTVFILDASFYISHFHFLSAGVRRVAFYYVIPDCFAFFKLFEIFFLSAGVRRVAFYYVIPDCFVFFKLFEIFLKFFLSAGVRRVIFYYVIPDCFAFFKLFEIFLKNFFLFCRNYCIYSNTCYIKIKTSNKEMQQCHSMQNTKKIPTISLR